MCFEIFFAEYKKTLGKELLCRIFDTRQRSFFAERKKNTRQRSARKTTLGKPLTLGKKPVSGSTVVLQKSTEVVLY